MALLPGVVFALHGKIVFYDGTYVVGKVTKVDESSVYIVPIGLDTAEGVLVGNIDSLKVENGMVPVVNSSVKYFYQNGEFMANDSDWMDEYDDFKYNEYTSLQEEYNYKEVKKDKIDSHFSSSTNKSEWLPFTDTKGRTKKGLRQSLLDRIEEERLVLLRLT